MGRPARSSPHRLLVEGQDDLFAIAHLIRARFAAAQSAIDLDAPSPNAPWIEQHDGLENLLKAGNIESAAKTYLRLGIVVDADQVPAAHWRAVVGRLATVGVTVPASPATGGVIVPGYQEGWRVGVWLMPDNARPGALEDFLLPLMPGEDALWPEAVRATDAAVQVERRFGVNDDLKARLRCWLAWQAEPGANLGVAVSRGVLDPLSPAADPFARWVEALFA